jgi:VIT1/CCC1 family predicted Fe2+/Mn2+ transporter
VDLVAPSAVARRACAIASLGEGECIRSYQSAASFGAAATGNFFLLAGLASLTAGACSMVLGEYVSMRVPVELLGRLLDEEREAIRT